MQFRPKTEYAPPPAPSGARVQLAEAIAERNEARQSVIDARDAEEKARLATYAAEHDADELRRQANESGSASDVVAAISGGVDDILALERPRETLRAKIEGMVERVAAWRRAANLAEQQIPIRTAALDRAERKVVDAAKAVARARSTSTGFSPRRKPAPIGFETGARCFCFSCRFYHMDRNMTRSPTSWSARGCKTN